MHRRRSALGPLALLSLAVVRPSPVLAGPVARVAPVEISAARIEPVAAVRQTILSAFAAPVSVAGVASPASFHPALTPSVAVFLQRTAALATPTVAAAGAPSLKTASTAPGETLATVSQVLSAYPVERLEKMSPAELDEVSRRILEKVTGERLAAAVPVADAEPVAEDAAPRPPLRGFIAMAHAPLAAPMLLQSMHSDLTNAAALPDPAARAERLQELSAEQRAVLTGLRDSEAVPPGFRRSVGAALKRLYGTGNLVAEELLKGREVRHRLDALAAALPAPRAETGAWKLPTGPAADAGSGNVIELRELRDRLDGLLARLEFAGSRGRPLAEAAETLVLLKARTEWYFHHLKKWASLLEPRHDPEGTVWTPENPNLVLRRTPGGFVLEADFESSISDPRVLDYFRDSIERYWRGEFEHEGRTATFETKVKIRRVGPGENFSPDALRVIEAVGRPSHASRDFVALNRTDMSRADAFVTAPHEFAHVLGLPDEYAVEYDPVARRVSLTGPQDSLMAARHGRVLPRHLAKVVGLLVAGGRSSTAP